jgi:hypothetical protein
MAIGAIAPGLLAAACSVGQGRGWIGGEYHDAACMVDAPDYQMNPTFFSADVIEDPGAAPGRQRSRLNIRIQRGSYREGDSDGLLLFVRDVNAIKGSEDLGLPSLIGVPIPISDASDALVQMTLYMNESCQAGFPREFWTVPGVLEGRRGEIVFDAIYAPDVDPSSTAISAHFTDVEFGVRDRDDRRAIMSGEFTFYYQRGRPAQPFP